VQLRATKLCVLCCRILAVGTAAAQLGGDAADVLAVTVMVLTARSSWPHGAAQSADGVLTQLETRHGVLASIAVALRHAVAQQVHASGRMQELIHHMWARLVLDLPSVGAPGLLDLLAIPHLWRCCPALAQHVHVTTQLLVPTLHVAAAHASSATPPMSAVTAIHLLGNVVELTAAAEHAWSAAPAVAFAHATTALLARMPATWGAAGDASAMTGDADSDSDGDGGRDADGDAIMSDTTSVPTSSTLQPPVEVAAQLQALREPAVLRSWLLAALPACDSAATSANPDALHAMSGLLHAVLHTRLLRHESEGRHRVLSMLAFSADVVPRMWAAIASCAHSTSAAQLAQPLAVLATVYSHALITADDEELCATETAGIASSVLFADGNARLVRLLRDILWHALWVDADRLGMTALQLHWPRQVIRPMAKLFAQLHARNGRRQFVAPAEFCPPELADEDGDAAKRILKEESRASNMLRMAPALVPFLLRARLFRDRCERDRENAMESSSGASMMLPWHMPAMTGVTVRRDALFDDGFAGLSALSPEKLKGIIRVRFVNELGAPEAGVDGGGLFKDFLDGFWTAAFAVPGLWNEASGHRVAPNPRSNTEGGAQHLRLFRFCGAMLARAMYEGILAETPLADFLYAKLRGDGNQLHDLASLDEGLHRSLLALKKYNGDHSALCLSFTVSDGGRDVALVPDGHNTPVTAANKLTYIHLVAHYKLTASIRTQCAAFVGGFQDIIPAQWVRMFSPGELATLVSGSRNPRLDVRDLAAHAAYSGGYTAEHPTVRALWDVVQDLSPGEQSAFLKFVTACSRPPLLGFRDLQPQFTVHRAGVPSIESPDEAADTERLPTAATCLALLKLPPYRSKNELRAKLVMAITSHAGFDLS